MIRASRASDRLAHRALVVLALALIGCEGGALGVACDRDEACSDRLRCAIRAGMTTGACMVPCDAATLLCDDGSVCLDVQASRVCWIGGRVPLGFECTSDLECEPGTVCAPEGLCIQRCLAGATHSTCRPEEVCASGLCRTRS